MKSEEQFTAASLLSADLIISHLEAGHTNRVNEAPADRGRL
jgi:hypothetical protein